jgi:FixJ family two-component response regulator
MRKKKFRISILDDDPAVTRALDRLLSANQFDVQTYENASELIASMEFSSPDCLILDLFMGDMSGSEIHEHLRAKNIVVPTIIITAHAAADMHTKYDAKGIAAFLGKPLHGPTLIQAIYAAIKSDQIKADF